MSCPGSRTSRGDMAKTARFREAMKYFFDVGDDWPYGRVACTECDAVVRVVRSDGTLAHHNARRVGQKKWYGHDYRKPWVNETLLCSSAVRDACAKAADGKHAWKLHLTAMVGGRWVRLPGGLRVCAECGEVR